jgi:hypothetical protein
MSDGTATAGSDYFPSNGTLTFSPGEVNKCFNVTINNDSLPETDETVNLALENPSNATLGMHNHTMLTIVDDNDFYFHYLPIILSQY